MSIFDEASTDALALTGEALAVGSIYSVDATDTISLSELIHDVMIESSDTLSLTDTATVIKEIVVQAADAITLTDLYTDVWVWNTNWTDELEVTEEQFDPDTLTYTDVDIGLREEALAGGFVSVSTSDNIPFVETNNRWIIPAAGATEAAVDTLSLTERALEPVEAKAKDSLGLSDVATASVSQPSDDSIEFTDVATSVVDYNDLQASDTLSLTEANNPLLIEFQPTCRPEFTYSEYIDPYTAEHGTTGFRLQYPATGTVTDELILRNPNFGNKDRITPNRVNNQSRGGDLIIYADPLWGDPVEALLYSFSVLTAVEAAALATWFDTYLGQEIRLIDQENRLWRGFMTQVTDPIVHDRRKSYTASFEFEGSKV